MSLGATPGIFNFIKCQGILRCLRVIMCLDILDRPLVAVLSKYRALSYPWPQMCLPCLHQWASLSLALSLFQSLSFLLSYPFSLSLSASLAVCLSLSFDRCLCLTRTCMHTHTHTDTHTDTQTHKLISPLNLKAPWRFFWRVWPKPFYKHVDCLKTYFG